MSRRGRLAKTKEKFKSSCRAAIEGNNKCSTDNCEIDLDSQAIVTFGNDDLGLDSKNLLLIKSLDSGNYGSVDLRKHSPSGHVFAVKQIQISATEQTLIKKEIDVLKLSLNCPHVVRFYGAFFQEGTAWICMEPMDTCMKKFYKEVFKIQPLMPENVLGVVTVSVLQALNFLKSELSVIHRDVKPSNVLIDKMGTVKICDFGISGCLVDSKVKSYVGCMKYMAPELFDTTHRMEYGYDVRSDVWSLGITLLEISSGKVPFEEHKSPYEMMNFLMTGDIPHPNADYSEQFKYFLSLCLQKDYTKRPYYGNLLQDQFPQQYEKSIYDSTYTSYVSRIVSVVAS